MSSGDTQSRTGRRSGARSGGRRQEDPAPRPISPDNLDALLAGLEQFAAAIPPGHELFSAIYDLDAGASDLVMRDRAGQTRFILGLSGAQHERLGRLLAWVDEGLEDGEIYRTIVEQSPVPFLVIRRDGTIEFASPSVVTSLGMRTPRQLVGTMITDLIHPEDNGRMSPLARHAPAGAPTPLRVLLADGQFRHVDLTVRSLSGEGRLLLVLQPTDGARDGDELAVSERQQRALADVADCGTALLGAHAPGFGEVIATNAEFARMTATDSEASIGRSVWTFFGVDDTGRILDAVRRAADGEGASTLNVQLSADPDRQIECLITPDRSSGEPPSRLAIRIRDVRPDVRPEPDRLTSHNDLTGAGGGSPNTP